MIAVCLGWVVQRAMRPHMWGPWLSSQPRGCLRSLDAFEAGLVKVAGVQLGDHHSHLLHAQRARQLNKALRQGEAGAARRVAGAAYKRGDRKAAALNACSALHALRRSGMPLRHGSLRPTGCPAAPAACRASSTHLCMLTRLAATSCAAGGSGLKPCLKAAGGAVHNQQCSIRLGTGKTGGMCARRGGHVGRPVLFVACELAQTLCP